MKERAVGSVMISISLFAKCTYMATAQVLKMCLRKLSEINNKIIKAHDSIKQDVINCIKSS